MSCPLSFAAVFMQSHNLRSTDQKHQPSSCFLNARSRHPYTKHTLTCSEQDFCSCVEHPPATRGRLQVLRLSCHDSADVPTVASNVTCCRTKSLFHLCTISLMVCRQMVSMRVAGYDVDYDSFAVQSDPLTRGYTHQVVPLARGCTTTHVVCRASRWMIPG